MLRCEHVPGLKVRSCAGSKRLTDRNEEEAQYDVTKGTRDVRVVLNEAKSSGNIVVEQKYHVVRIGNPLVPNRAKVAKEGVPIYQFRLVDIRVHHVD